MIVQTTSSSRITAQPIESQEETHLWANTVDRVMTDMLTVQTEVAEEIAKAVLASRVPAAEVP